MDTTEALLHSLATAVNGQSTLNLSQKSSWHKAPVSSDITVDLQGPYQRIDIIPELERCLGHSFPHPNDEGTALCPHPSLSVFYRLLVCFLRSEYPRAAVNCQAA